MSTKRCPFLPLLALAMLPLVGAVARADDPPAPPPASPSGSQPPTAPDPGAQPDETRTAAPELPTGKEPYLAPVDRTDLLRYLGTLQEQVEMFQTPPPQTDEVTALRDAWKAIMKPRVFRMNRRLERWRDPEHWVWVQNEPTPRGLKAEEWPAFVHDMAGLVTELEGAWEQYGAVRLEKKPALRGPDRIASPIPAWVGYPYARLYASVLDRESAAGDLGRWNLTSYWSLLNRFDRAYWWTLHNRRTLYEQPLTRGEATRVLFHQLYGDLLATRDALQSLKLGVQVLVAALQNVEETSLESLCLACHTDDETLRHMGETALASMQQLRLEGERFHGDSPADYGSILRRWLRADRAAHYVMKVAQEPEEPSADEEASASSGVGTPPPAAPPPEAGTGPAAR